MRIGVAERWSCSRRSSLYDALPAQQIGWLRWQRRRFREYWTRLSGRTTGGRPPVNPELKALVRKMATANPLWGAPRIHGEILKLGLDVAERTVSRLMPKRRPEPSQTWRTFLANHARDLVSIDFFTVPTARLRVLFVLVVLAHHRRHVIHFNITRAARQAKGLAVVDPRTSRVSYFAGLRVPVTVRSTSPSTTRK